MQDISLNTHLNSLTSPQKSPEAKSVGGFGEMFQTALKEVNKLQVESDQAMVKMQTGEASNLHEVGIAMEKADLSLRLVVQMRNKVLEAYQEIMRMQI